MPGESIAQEMEESLEVLFVHKGYYQVGYEINNKEFLRLKFGPSTIIGGMQIAFKKRFSFVYRAKTKMICYALRRQKYHQIQTDFSFFMA